LAESQQHFIELKEKFFQVGVAGGDEVVEPKKKKIVKKVKKE